MRAVVTIPCALAALCASLYLGCGGGESDGGRSGTGGSGGIGATGGAGGSGGIGATGGAGGSDSGSGGITGGVSGTDSGGAEDANADAAETGPDGGTGTAIAAGQYFVFGVTTDDRIIAQAAPIGNLVEFSLSGKMTVITNEYQQWAVARHTVVFVEKKSMGSGLTQAETIQAWVGGSLHPLAGAAFSNADAYDASFDSAFVAYTDGTHIGGPLTDMRTSVYVAKSDGTGEHEVAADVLVGSNGCQPQTLFSKTGKLVAGYCAAMSAGDAGAADSGALDGGTSAAWQLVAVEPASGAITPLATAGTSGTHRFRLDPTSETKLLVLDDNGALLLQDLAGGPPLILAGSGVVDFAWLPDGQNVLYVTSAGELRRASASSSPNPIVLVSVGAEGLISSQHGWGAILQPAVSPDGKWVLYRTSSGDLMLASATTPGSAVELAAAADSHEVKGNPFTSDSSNVIYYTGWTTGGTLWARPVAGGAAVQVSSGMAAWHLIAADDLLVFGDNVGPSNLLDLKSRAIAATAQSHLIASQVRFFWLDSTRKLVIYEIPPQGIYFAPLQ